MSGHRRTKRRFAAVVVLTSLATGASAYLVGAGSAAAAPPVVVAVSGNHLIDGSGATIRLLGVDRSGTEYACEQGWGIFDGPSDAASVSAIASWHVNALRLPLNEGCWLGLFTRSNDPYAIGDPTPYEGAAYRTAIANYVSLLHQQGIAVILELSGLDAPDGLGVPPMADAASSPTFWSSIASYFESDPGVVFDLYNEPNSISWPCWKSGCTVSTSAGSYQSVGMQQLVDSVRSTGATQPIMIGGLSWSSDETEWSTNMPTDPRASLVVSFHTYNSTNCNTLACWNATLVPLTESYPVVAGEIGEYDCRTPYTNSFMQFADSAGISYLGWAWDAIAPGGWQCGSPSLISNYDGTPSPEGVALQSHLLTLFNEQGSVPRVTKLSVAHGPGAGGTRVVIHGANFVGASAVEFGSEPATIASVNRAGTTITVTTPAEVAATVDVTVTNNAGTSAVGVADQFTYLGPKLLSLSPRHGPSAGGATVVVHGTHLQGASAVTFDASAAIVESVNRAGTTVTVLTPAHSPGTAEVTVTTPGGSSGQKAYTYAAPVGTPAAISDSGNVGATREKGAGTSPIDGVWDGTYSCGASQRGLDLQIKGPSSALTATFVFYPLPAAPGLLPGEFSMTGTYASSSSITLNPHAWIIQPGTYSMVGLSGSLSGKVFSGTVPGCGTFSVTKTTAPAPRSKLVGTWKGSYVGCSQGPTALKLQVSEQGASGDMLSAVFKFSALKSNPRVATGSYKMAGFVFPHWVVFIGTTWIHQPPAYFIVSLVGAPPAATTFKGVVTSCKTFSLKRTPPTP